MTTIGVKVGSLRPADGHDTIGVDSYLVGFVLSCARRYVVRGC